MIAKYLKLSSIIVSGFIMPEVHETDKVNEHIPILSLPDVRKRVNKEQIKVIIAVDDNMYNQVIAMLKMIGINDFYIVSEWNKRTIVKKMAPRFVEEFWVEVNLADHCNLNCQCCDHFSPIAKETFLDYEQYKKDIHRLAELTNQKMARVTLLGGEPLLNDKVIDYIKITREYLPNSEIVLFTDGLLLPKWGEYEDDRNIWKAVVKYDIQVNMTHYAIPLKLEQIINKAKAYGIPVTFEPPSCKGAKLWILSEIGDLKQGVKYSTKHPFDLNGGVEKYRFISCYHLNEVIVLRDGKIYPCPIVPYSHYFNERFEQNLQVREDCYIDIHQAQSFEEIAEFCTHRVSFCDYCEVHKRFTLPWKQSEHDMSEWTL